ncbi:MAG: hypothetical protein WB441_17490 [Nocardioidaceae bacterium]
MVSLARFLFRLSVLCFAMVVLVAGRELPVQVPSHLAVTGLADDWTSRAELVVMLSGAGLGAASVISALGTLLGRLPLRWVEAGPGDRDRERRSLRSVVTQDLYLVGVVLMLVLTLMTVNIVRVAVSEHPATGPWGAATAVLFTAGLAGLGFVRARSGRQVAR